SIEKWRGGCMRGGSMGVHHQRANRNGQRAKERVTTASGKLMVPPVAQWMRTPLPATLPPKPHRHACPAPPHPVPQDPPRRHGCFLCVRRAARRPVTARQAGGGG